MRADAIGFFWQDIPAVKVAKEAKPKRTPPERTWEREDYLPNLADALAFNVPQLCDQELLACRGDELLADVECYSNYFLIAFKHIKTGKVAYLESFNDSPMNLAKLDWILRNFVIVTFNGWSYDFPILTLALAGKSNVELKAATNMIIQEELRDSDVLKRFGVKRIPREEFKHIDLIEVAPLRASLKIYAGRLHARRMQDLPFPHDRVLTFQQAAIVRLYCVNDLDNTGSLRSELSKQLDLRAKLSSEYGTDLMSRSDAQIAETIISSEVSRLNGSRTFRPEIEPGTVYRYNVPRFLTYHTPLMNWVLDVVRNARFVVSEHGNVGMPKELSDLTIQIAGGSYRMGIGGLHSSEKTSAHVQDDKYVLSDHDVTSYYPEIILNLGLYPPHLGQAFLRVYRSIVERRIAAKRAGNKVEADSLKITINGSFGKLGSKYSSLYAPQLLIQVTVTGQLSLLMLIERLELAGIHVVSANTDGIVIKCLRTSVEHMNAIIAQWERDTGFETENTDYLALYSKDVNNYIAVKPNGEVKTKGVYAHAGLSKNPTNEICVDAVLALLTKRTPISATVRGCTDITKFVSVRTVKGGAVKDGEYLGKSIRWYYSTECPGEIVYASTGNKVPRSEGARPLMTLPDSLPGDIDFERYEREAESMLIDIGYSTPEKR